MQRMLVGWGPSRITLTRAFALSLTHCPPCSACRFQGQDGPSVPPATAQPAPHGQGAATDKGHPPALLGDPSSPSPWTGPDIKGGSVGRQRKKTKPSGCPALVSNDAWSSEINRQGSAPGPCGDEPQSWSRQAGRAGGRWVRWWKKAPGSVQGSRAKRSPDPCLNARPGPARLGWGLSFCISHEVPGNAAAATHGLGPPFEHLSVG